MDGPWDREAGTLTIRARARADLEALRDSYLSDLGDIVENGAADYRFRAQAPQASVAEAARRIVAGIDYDNFKSAVGERQGEAREDVYHRVWHELLAIQRSTRSRGR